MDVTAKQQNYISSLARTMASEGVWVSYQQSATTAAFDAKNRCVILPVFQGTSEFVNNLFVFHEIGHARYTPNDFLESLESEFPDWDVSEIHLFVNVIEDARIERLVKRKFPGSLIDFRSGYDELVTDHNFFETNGEDLTTYCLIDRINLEFKLGTCFPDRKIVSFSRAEQILVDMISDAETWEDVILCVRYYLVHWYDADVKTIRELEANRKTEDDGDPCPSSPGRSTGPLTSEAESSSVRSLSSVDRDGKTTVLIPFPKLARKFPVVPWKEFYTKIRGIKVNHVDDDSGFLKFNGEYRSLVSRAVVKFNQRMKSVGYNKRISVKFGGLDIKKLPHYQTIEDVFVKRTLDVSGKNHGIVVFLDWSASMTKVLPTMFKKMFFIWEFAKRAGIKLEVYAFQQTSMEFDKVTLFPPSDEFPGFWDFNLVQILTSDMNRSQVSKVGEVLLDSDIVKLLLQPTSGFPLGITPLDPCILTAESILNDFRKANSIDVLSAVFITDGGNTSPLLTSGSRPKVPAKNEAFSFYDRKTSKTYSQTEGVKQTECFLEYLGDKTGCSIIGYDFSRRSMDSPGYVKTTRKGYDSHTKIDVNKWLSGERKLKNLIVDDFIDMIVENFKNV